MVTRFIRSVVETVNPPRVKLEFVDDLRRRTFEIGGDIETVVAVTPRRDAAHVVEARVALVLEFEIVRVSTIMIADGKAALHGSTQSAMRPKTVRDKSVDSHQLDAVVFLTKQRIEPIQATFPARLTVPEELPRPPASAISSKATWKLIATLELNDGKVFRAEQVVTERG